ncbi:hypothetical protein DC58_19715 [Vibrio navarrensis]|uniref:hypothetical protein n=1 Tax=Vibrio navarrensis TaxID=29495 RepID=UPI00052DE9CA|nr:hypothetical protein [Vibrio navarrensis]KGK18651.1 hypothetical protein DC58_19715 [Vibrio navarrensis]
MGSFWDKRWQIIEGADSLYQVIQRSHKPATKRELAQAPSQSRSNRQAVHYTPPEIRELVDEIVRYSCVKTERNASRK